MKKSIFLEELREGLVGLPKEDVERTVEYYDELLCDRIEEGEGEESAVAAMPSIEEVRERALAEIPLVKLVGIKLKSKRRLSGGEIALIVVTFPLWFTLLAVAFSVAFSLYVVLWVPAVVFLSLFVGLIAAAIAGLGVGVVIPFFGAFSQSAICLGTAFLSAGLLPFVWLASKWSVKGMLFLTKKTALVVKKLFVKEKKI